MPAVPEEQAADARLLDAVADWCQRYTPLVAADPPDGILFDIATDGPGFATDEPMEKLGEKLALPPFLEPRRSEIEAGLKPL